MSRPGSASSRCRRVAIRIRPGAWACRSRPVRDCGITLVAPARRPAHIQTVFGPGSADGKWWSPPPSLASRKRSSMLVRLRKPRFQTDVVTVAGGDVGDDEADRPDVLGGAAEGQRELVGGHGAAAAAGTADRR